jgi:hypothetical protein
MSNDKFLEGQYIIQQREEDVSIFFFYSMYILCLRFAASSVSDPDPLGSAFNWSPGSGSAFGMRIRICIRNADPDPGGIKRAKMKKKAKLKDR